jgi:hypothetical protein
VSNQEAALSINGPRTSLPVLFMIIKNGCEANPKLNFEQFNLLKSTGHVMRQQLYALPTLYLCVLYLSENKQRLVPLTA